MTRPSSNTENSGAGCTAKKKPKRATWEKRDARVKEKDTRHRRRVETPHAAAYLLTCWHVTAINSHVSMKYITEQERPCQVLCGAISGRRAYFSSPSAPLRYVTQYALHFQPWRHLLSGG